MTHEDGRGWVCKNNILASPVINFIKQELQQERERMWQDYKTQETMHKMMLDSLSIMCIKQFVKWREEHINLINQDHE